MQQVVIKQQERLAYPQLPLAVYREIVAHLRQVEGVEADLIPQSASQPFDYLESQTKGLWLNYNAAADANSKQRVKEILDYYAKRFHKSLVRLNND